LRVRWTAAVCCLFAGMVTALTGCQGSAAKDDGIVSGNRLTIYSSLPLQGPGRKQSEDVVRAEKLALKQHGGRIGKFKIAFRSLDDSTPQAAKWEPNATSANARKAARDETAIGYLGELDSGATAISLPTLNEAGIMQVTPASTALELTKDVGPSDNGAPEKYYPRRRRTLARAVPTDDVQGIALARWMKELGVRKLYILNDREVYGSGVAKSTSDAAERAGIEVVADDGIDRGAASYRSAAQKAKRSGADAVLFGGIYANGGVRLFKDLGAALPDAKLFGADGVAESEFAKALPDSVAKQTHITVATIDRKDYPPKGRRFFKDYEAEYGDKSPDPYAIHGYAAMDILLTAMEAAGAKANQRRAVVREVYKLKGEQGVLGRFDIDRDGDISLNQFGRYRVRDRDLAFDKAVTVARASKGRRRSGR
jgi:branched-chain amino acid transport system substrate-binding protein